MTGRRPSILYAFFCEFLRPEEGGKTTALGLWGRSCVFQGRSPGIFAGLALHAQVANPSLQPWPFKIHIEFPGNEPPPVDHEARLSSRSSGNNINLTLFGIVVKHPGVIHAGITIEDDGGQPVTHHVDLEVSFREREDCTPPGIPQPPATE